MVASTDLGIQHVRQDVSTVHVHTIKDNQGRCGRWEVPRIIRESRGEMAIGRYVGSGDRGKEGNPLIADYYLA